MNFALLLCFFPIVALGYDVLYSVKLTVPTSPEKEHCFSETVEKGVKEIQIDFTSNYGDGVQVVVKVNDSVRFEMRTSRGHWLEKNINFDNYTFCISGAEKQVFFQIWHMKEEDLIEEKKMAHISDDTLARLGRFAISASELNRRLDEISSNLREAEKTQLEFRHFEKRDLEQARDLSKGVVFWSLFVSSYFVFMSIGMIFAVRTLFDEDSTVGKILRKGKLD